MSRFLLDTDTLSLLEQGHAIVSRQVNSHPLTDVSFSVITLQEQVRGFEALLSRARNHQQIARAYDMLVSRLLPAWKHFSVLSFSEPALQRFDHLRSLRLNVGLMDLRIAAIALENSLAVVTRNQRDFNRVPGLSIVDWSM